MNIGQRIKNKRKESGMTLEELAKRIGKNRSTVYRYENGDIENMPLDILEPIAKALHTTPAYLMGWDEEEIEAVSEMQSDSDSYEDAQESALKSMFEFAESSLTPSDIDKVNKFIKSVNNNNACDLIFELDLTDEEIEELYKYAKYLISKRNQ